MRGAYKRGGSSAPIRSGGLKQTQIANVSTAALSLAVQSAHGETAIINREQALGLGGCGMTIPYVQHFDANLPSVAAPVRITSIYDAQIFTRRWVIRDKDRNLKTLLRKLEKANSGALIDEAMVDFKQALSARALLSAKL